MALKVDYRGKVRGLQDYRFCLFKAVVVPYRGSQRVEVDFRNSGEGGGGDLGDLAHYECERDLEYLMETAI